MAKLVGVGGRGKEGGDALRGVYDSLCKRRGFGS